MPNTMLLIYLEGRDYDLTSKLECKARELKDGLVGVLFQGPSRSRKARLVANPSYGAEEQFLSRCSNMMFRHILISGNKLKRDYEKPLLGWEDNQWTYHTLCDAGGWRSAGLILENVFNVTLDDVELVDIACGTGVGIKGSERVTLRNVRLDDLGFEPPEILLNGQEVLAGPKKSFHYSDGVTSEYCKDCHFEDIFIYDVTDIGLALGGGPGNTVERVYCSQKRRRALTCVSVGRFGTGRQEPVTGQSYDGYHPNLLVQDVEIVAEDGKLPFGFTIGTHYYCHPQEAWCRESIVHDGGIVRRIKVSGAQVGFGVDGVEKVEVSELTLGEPLGDRSGYFIKCPGIREKFIAGHIKSGVKLPPGARSFHLDFGECPK